MVEAEAYSRLAGVYDEIVVDPSYRRWAHYLHELWSSDERPVVSVLDVCCGNGRVTLPAIAPSLAAGAGWRRPTRESASSKSCIPR